MPWLRRRQVFEIDDQEWFPPFLRSHIQNALTLTWTTAIPFSVSPATHAASVLRARLPADLSTYTFIDFCAGGGGPTPAIERLVNDSLRARDGGDGDDGDDEGVKEATFVMTDLFPNVESWKRLVRGRRSLFFEEKSVDARDGGEVVGSWAEGRTCRLFNLAFHHFDDQLAGDILQDTVQNSDAFAIFELQSRTLQSFVTTALLLPAALLVAPLYALRHRSLSALLFTYLLPVIPFVLVFDGWMSGLRTRTPAEVEAMLRARGGAEAARWRVESGRERFLWPFGYVDWIVASKD